MILLLQKSQIVQQSKIEIIRFNRFQVNRTWNFVEKLQENLQRNRSPFNYRAQFKITVSVNHSEMLKRHGIFIQLLILGSSIII